MIFRRVLNVPTWRPRSPFAELDRIRRQMDRLLEDTRDPYGRVGAGVFPPVNLTEDKNSYYLRTELPGVSSEDLELQATGNNLSIAGQRKIAEEQGARYHRREREAGTFSRVISLPGEIDSDRLEARLKDGVLTVVIPKAEVAKPKQIAIKS